MRRASLIATAVLLTCAAGQTTARASVSIGAKRIVVTARGGQRAIVTRTPYRLSFEDRRGRRVLSEVRGSANGSTLVEPPVTQTEFGAQTPAPPSLYAPLAFVVGTHSISQTPAGQWEGTLQSVTQGGIASSAGHVISASPVRGRVVMVVSTSAVSGAQLEVVVVPRGRDAFTVSARVIPGGDFVAISDSFQSTPREAFHGFGGHHDGIDQHGREFFNYLEQENVSSGSANGITAVTPGAGDSFMFPNGPSAAYYVQSSFVSSDGYGFLLDRAGISHWRLDSDLPRAWQVETAGRVLRYVVAPAQPRRAVSDLTAITGRQPPPPRWALGPILDRLVKFPSDPATQYRQEVARDLRDIRRYHLPLDGYRIEGWQFLPRPILRHFIARLHAMGIHPMLYFRSFVGQDTIGTDDPTQYDRAIAKGYVATHADGSPYIFTSNFNANAAQIDFTNPAAVRWWQRRVKAGLRLGADGFMEDFGEQVLNDMHFFDGSTGATMHNKLPVLYHRATRQAIDSFERHHPHRHIFSYTRSGYSGTPGSAAYEGGNFPGDETTDWTKASGLASQTPDMLNRAIGGAFGFTTDIGGFFDVGPYQATTKELFLRWAEWAALSPFFRLHGSVAAGTHTPWSYDHQTLRIYKRLERLHLRARPLIARLWRRGDRTGIPVTRPLWFAYPHDAVAARQDQEWLLGPNVLVAPVVRQGSTSRSVYLPRGCWRDGHSGARVQGPGKHTVAAPLARLPYFLRCGTRPLAGRGG